MPVKKTQKQLLMAMFIVLSLALLVSTHVIENGKSLSFHIYSKEKMGRPTLQEIDNVELQITNSWFSQDNENTRSLAWGDMDNDGDLDLAAGNRDGVNKVYLSEKGVLAVEPVWSSSDEMDTESLAWGDVDGDGDLDLAAGNEGANVIYLNTGGMLESDPYWVSNDHKVTKSIAWGDMDGDGDLDLAVGNWLDSNAVYLNDGGVLQKKNIWTSLGGEATTSIAWGDMDGDGDLDLAAGNELDGFTFNTASNIVYLNTGKILQKEAVWTAPVQDNTHSVAWGDMNGDGKLDLAIGNKQGSDVIYLNRGDILETAPAWISSSEFDTNDIAWGDIDADGDLDLATASTIHVVNGTGHNSIYLNENGALQATPVWISPDFEDTHTVKWGDVDGDGDLDLAAGNKGSNRVYENQKMSMSNSYGWFTQGDDVTTSIAWGDMDGDSDLDLAVGNLDNAAIYFNENNILQGEPGWRSKSGDITQDIAWGDMDGDGDLDLAVGNANGSDKVYLNQEGIIQDSPAWLSEDISSTYSIAWGDMDGDGDLDLAVGRNGSPDKVYLNDFGMLNSTAIWESDDQGFTSSIAWGDLEGDGDLDLAIASRSGPDKIYLNEGSILQSTHAWLGRENSISYSVSWGDMDGNGQLDLAVGKSGSNEVYLNEGGMLGKAPVWQSPDADNTNSIAWGDADNDGDLDLAAGNSERSNKIYLNENGMLQTIPAWYSQNEDYTRSIAWGDMDGDGDLDLATGNLDIRTDTGSRGVYVNNAINIGGFGSHQQTSVSLSLESAPYMTFSGKEVTSLAPADFYSVPGVREGPVISIPYSVVDFAGIPLRSVHGFYSLDGGGNWHSATSSENIMKYNNVSAAAYNTVSDPPEKSQEASLPAYLENSILLPLIIQGGQSQEYSLPLQTQHVFNWDIYASGFFGHSDNVVFRLEAYPGGANSFSIPFVASQTYPFRARGTQVRVFGDVVADNHARSNAFVYRLPKEASASADAISDLRDVPYRTNGEGYLAGRGRLDPGDQLVALLPITSTESYTLYHTSAAVTDTGLAMYTVEAAGVQNLVVSSENPLVLFDVDVSLEWDAHNDTQFMEELSFNIERTSELLYDWSNGQVALGEVTVYHAREMWNDAHVRIRASNRLRPNADQGGVISDVVTEVGASGVITYTPGQVRMGATWNRHGDFAAGNLDEDWPRALAHELGHYLLFLDDNYLGLDGEQVISVESCPGAMNDPYSDNDAEGYDEFHPDADWVAECAQTFSHQETGRSDWSTIRAFYPALHERDNPGPNVLPLAVTQIEFREPLTPTETLPVPFFYLLNADGSRYDGFAGARAILLQDERLIDLGQPVADQVQARGARAGDQLCVLDSGRQQAACETITPPDEQLQLQAQRDWEPVVVVSPITSTTVQIGVENLAPGLDLRARLYPMSTDASPEISLVWDDEGQMYTGQLVAPEPTSTGHVLVWDVADADVRVAVADYAVGGNPAGRRGFWAGRRGFWAGRRGFWAPIASSDGQAILVGRELEFSAGEFYAMQTATHLPSLPDWATRVGQAYWLTGSENAPDLSSASLYFSYLGRDVPPGEESFLRVLFWNGTEWQTLATTLDTFQNIAIAAIDSPGLYALISTIDIPLSGPGWNNIAYPVQASRAVSEALTSIAGSYSVVYGYEQTQPQDPWRVHGPDAEAWANDLAELLFGKGYWIYATEPVTLHLKGGDAPTVQAAASNLTPPAVYYGTLVPSLSFAPSPGMSVSAFINDTACGTAITRKQSERIVYQLKVAADDGAENFGCGSPDRPVRFVVDGIPMTTQAENVVWDNQRVWNVSITN